MTVETKQKLRNMEENHQKMESLTSPENVVAAQN